MLRKLMADGVLLIAEREGPDAAHEVLRSLRRIPRHQNETMDDIARRIAFEADIDIDDLRGLGRIRQFSDPRLRAYAEIYATGRYSLPRIGRYFNRDHTTVLTGIRRHNRRAAQRRLAEASAA